jgi:hypothetical protein
MPYVYCVRHVSVMYVCVLCVWCGPRLWRRAVERLSTRPKVDWDAVDREKGRLEEDQRLLPVHQTPPGPWHTKVFHEVPFANPVTHETIPFFTFDQFVSAGGACGAGPIAWWLSVWI